MKTSFFPLLGRAAVWGGVLFALTACGAPAYREATYTLPVTPGARLCAEQCKKSRDYCRGSCDLDYRACYNGVLLEAQRAYDKYARERFMNRSTASMMPSDFEHPEACNAEKKSCVADCDSPYDSCYRACGGEVAVTSSCQFLCFE